MHTRAVRLFSSIVVVLAFSFSNSHAAFIQPNLVPQPVRMLLSDGSFTMTAATAVTAETGAEAEAGQFADALGLKLRNTSARSSPRTGNISFALKPSLQPTLGPEGYHLSVSPDGIRIRAAAAAGLFYAGITLRQLLPVEVWPRVQGTAAEAWVVPAVEIVDHPRFAWRGLLVDVGRHYMPVEFLKKTVDLLALHKLNTLQLHLTDDQGWRLEIKKYPRLTQIGSVRKESPLRADAQRGDNTRYGPFFYTQDQIRELVAYAEARHVTILPEIEMPGHFLAALAAYPELSCRGGPFEVRTRWGVEPDILCAGNEESFAFVENVLSEVIDLFPSRFIHIGGDEAPRVRWKECPKCQARIRAEGLKNEAQLQTYFNRRIEEFLVIKGRRLIGWDEILEGGLTPGAAVMSWRGIEGGIAAANAGHDVVMSPTSHCYFDYAQSRNPGEPAWAGGYIPLETVYAFEPIPPSLSASKRRHILGGQGNVWTEFLELPGDVEYFAFPRAAALAEVLWSPREALVYESFRLRLPDHLKRLDRWPVQYRKLDPAK